MITRHTILRILVLSLLVLGLPVLPSVAHARNLRLMYFNVLVDSHDLQELSKDIETLTSGLSDGLSRLPGLWIMSPYDRDNTWQENKIDPASCKSGRKCRIQMLKVLPSIDLVLTAKVVLFGRSCSVSMQVGNTRKAALASSLRADGISCDRQRVLQVLKDMASHIWPRSATVGYNKPAAVKRKTSEFGLGGVLQAVPEVAEVEAYTGSGMRSDLPVAVEEAYYLALGADETGAQNEDAAVKAWEKLAKIKKDNPYRQDATQRAARWRKHKKERLAAEKAQRDRAAALRKQQAKDSSKVERLVRLPKMPVARKQALFTEYAGLYGWPAAAGLLDAVQPSEQVGKLEKALPKLKEAKAKYAGMVRVPAGEFDMGCNASVDSECQDNEKPQHSVYLDGFWIDKTEVTVKAYRKCVNAGTCSRPDDKSSDKSCNWGYSARGNHPVNCVDWNQAKTYCSWKGRRLPTEAQWEKAARGTDGRKYAWGNEQVSCDYAVIYDGGAGCGKHRTWPVCSKPRGNSVYGACDMIGNVWEWTLDWYGKGYYKSSRSRNPGGPSSGSYCVLRGGSWGSSPGFARASSRSLNTPSYRFFYSGFRCVR